MTRLLPVAWIAVLAAACAQTPASPPAPSTPPYFDNTGRDDALAGGVKMIPITTPKGTFNVWTKRVGSNPTIKVLLLHGGPGATHEYFEAFDSYFPAAGIEYYYYDQLGSAYSDQPSDVSLWDLPRFVEEVEQVRAALKLDKDNFFLLGQSWGGLLAIEYALKYQQHLKGLVVSNMMSSIPKYNEYAKRVLIPAMDQQVVAQIYALEKAGKYEDPKYMALLVPNFYTRHILRLPAEQWPEPVNRSFKHINNAIYVRMQGPSEMGAGGTLVNWDRSGDLKNITVSSLTIGATYDTMDPEHMKWMAGQMPKGRFLLCPNGSHLAEYDDQQTYFSGLVRFLKDVDAGTL